jgi:hypothetical protein
LQDDDDYGYLRAKYLNRWIKLKVAIQYAPNVEELKMATKGIKTTASGIL